MGGVMMGPANKQALQAAVVRGPSEDWINPSKPFRDNSIFR